MRASPASTERPSPVDSAGGRGAASPPSSSGQQETTRPSARQAESKGWESVAARPS